MPMGKESGAHGPRTQNCFALSLEGMVFLALSAALPSDWFRDANYDGSSKSSTAANCPGGLRNVSRRIFYMAIFNMPLMKNRRIFFAAAFFPVTRRLAMTNRLWLRRR